ncbi:hypothetical protein ACT4UT_20870, partial [Bacillus sp. B-TM1]
DGSSWKRLIEKDYTVKQIEEGMLGLGLSIFSLIIFGGNNFIIPAMIMILLILTILKKPIENVEEVSV